MKNEYKNKPVLIGHVLRKSEGKSKWIYCYSDGSEAEVPNDIETLEGPTLNNSWGKISAMLKDRIELLAALIELRDHVKEDSPDMWGRVDAAIAKAKGE